MVVEERARAKSLFGLRSSSLLQNSHSPRKQRGPWRCGWTCPCGANPAPPWTVCFFVCLIRVGLRCERERDNERQRRRCRRRQQVLFRAALDFWVFPISQQLRAARPAAIPFLLRDSASSFNADALQLVYWRSEVQNTLVGEVPSFNLSLKKDRNWPGSFKASKCTSKKKTTALSSSPTATFLSHHLVGRVVEHLRPERAQAGTPRARGTHAVAGPGEAVFCRRLDAGDEPRLCELDVSRRRSRRRGGLWRRHRLQIAILGDR